MDANFLKLINRGKMMTFHLESPISRELKYMKQRNIQK